MDAFLCMGKCSPSLVLLGPCRGGSGRDPGVGLSPVLQVSKGLCRAPSQVTVLEENKPGLPFPCQQLLLVPAEKG